MHSDKLQVLVVQAKSLQNRYDKSTVESTLRELYIHMN